MPPAPPPSVELPLHPGRAGERLLLPGPWPDAQVGWLQLAVLVPSEVQAGAEQDRFLELQVLVEGR